MKLRTLLTALALALLPFSHATAQDGALAAPAAPTIETDLEALVTKISQKIRGGERSASALAPELAEFDALLAKYPGKNDETAKVAFMKALLYAQVLNDEVTARKLFSAIKADYPGTEAAANVDSVVEHLDRSIKAKATLAALPGKPAPELHFKWSSRTGLKTLSSLKGNVVVLDFWATWCGPCIDSFQQIREHVAHFKGSPVVFVGVTSIQGYVSNLEPQKIITKGDPEREIALTGDFMKAKDMTWDVAISDEEVFNPDYGIQGIPYVAIIAPDGTVRHAGLHPGDPEGDIAGKVEAILKEFRLPTPRKS